MTDALTNNPPAVEQHKATIAELEIELEPYLTGADIADDATAAKLTGLLDKVVAAEKAAEAAKEAEYRPVKTQLDGITAEWKPVFTIADRIRKTARPLLTKWQQHKDALARKAAAEAAAEAEAKRRAAEEALRASAGDLEARRDAEAMAEEAKTYEIAAKVIAKAPTRLKVGGRSVQMRKRYETHIVDTQESTDAAITWAWERDFPRCWAALRPVIEAMAVEHAKAANAKPGRFYLADGAIVVTTTEEAI